MRQASFLWQGECCGQADDDVTTRAGVILMSARFFRLMRSGRRWLMWWKDAMRAKQRVEFADGGRARYFRGLMPRPRVSGGQYQTGKDTVSSHCF